MHTPEEILQEWFGDPARWWKSDPAFDGYLRQTYGDDVAAALRGELDRWADSPPGGLALVLLLDQFARNIHRGTHQMYAGDDKALAVCRTIIDRGEDTSYSDDERQFLYMPLMHSEDREAQRRSLEKFAEIGSSLDYARHHAEIVFRFGRFPHRNAILGRRSTAAEIEFLKEPGSSW